MAAQPPITPVTGDDDEQTQPRLTIDPQITAPDGSFYVFDGQTGYRQVVAPWAVEQHIGPIRAAEKLGSVESWVAYVTTYGEAGVAFLTWNTRGLFATLDYHGQDGAPNRAQWRAEHPFVTTRQWDAWMRLADNRARSQKDLIEALEERRLDIIEPEAAPLVELLRALRVTVNVSAESNMDGHGNTNLRYERNATTPLKLPPSVVISVPVLKGHTTPDENGIEGPVPYRLEVLIRVDLIQDGEKTRPVFRLVIPNAEQALEDAVGDRVRAAQALLDDEEGDWEILRAAS